MSHAEKVIEHETSRSSSGLTQLMIACRFELEHDVEVLLGCRVSVSERSPDGQTALHCCADNRRAACAALLLARDPTLIDTRDAGGATALATAVRVGNGAMVAWLVSRGADVNCRDSLGHTLLHQAAAFKQAAMIDLLCSPTLNLSLDTSSVDVHGATPLHYAAQTCDNSKTLLSLLARNVFVDATDLQQRTPLMWAAVAGNSEACEALAQTGASVDAIDQDGLTALHCAASEGHAACVEALLRSGASVDAPDQQGCTPLFYPLTLKHRDCATVLLETSANPNTTDVKKRSPGHCSAAAGDVEMLKVLKNAGGNLWMPTVNGDYPIHEAALAQNNDAVYFLIENSRRPEALINLSNLIGRSSLHVAAMTDNLPLICYLLSHDAHRNLLMHTPSKAMTPYDVAVHMNHTKCAEYLKQHGAKPAKHCTGKRAMAEDQDVKKAAEFAALNESKTQSEIDREVQMKLAEEIQRAAEKARIYAKNLESLSNALVDEAIEKAISAIETDLLNNSIRNSVQTHPVPSEVDSKVQRSDKVDFKNFKIKAFKIKKRPMITKKPRIVVPKVVYNDHAKSVYAMPQLPSIPVPQLTTSHQFSSSNHSKEANDMKINEYSQIYSKRKKNYAKAQFAQQSSDVGISSFHFFAGSSVTSPSCDAKKELTLPMIKPAKSRLTFDSSHMQKSRNGLAQVPCMKQDFKLPQLDIIKLSNPTNNEDRLNKHQCEHLSYDRLGMFGKLTHRNIIQEFVRVFEVKRLTASELYAAKRRLMHSKFEDDLPEGIIVQRLAKEYSASAFVDAEIDGSRFSGLSDFQRFLCDQYKDAKNYEELLRKLAMVNW